MKKVCSNCKTENPDDAMFCQSCGEDLNDSINTIHDEKSPNRNWRIINSLWIILTFSLGLLNWLAFLYIGIRVRQRKWILSGIVYAIPITLGLLLFNTAIYKAWFGTFFAYLFLITGIISIIHAFMIRREYLVRLEAKQEVDHAIRDKKEDDMKRKLIDEYTQSKKN